MNILGISFGKKNANTDILVKEALYGARAAAPDAKISFVNTVGLNIGRCRGCGACSTMLERGKDNDCVYKDDFQMLEEKVREADCIILGAPVYVLQPVGQFKDFVDRFSCRHDYSAITWVLDKRRKGELPGNAEDYPMERLKKRTVSYISVGGASTENWTSMGTATLHLFGFPPMMKVMGNYNANSMGTIGNPYLDDRLIADMHEMGKRTVEGYLDDTVPFFQPEGKPEGVCPVCHQRLVTILPGTTKVECPVCGIEGDLTIENGAVKIVYPKAQQERARGTFRGLREHTTEIQGFGSICGPKIMANREKLDRLMQERIKNFATSIDNKTDQA